MRYKGFSYTRYLKWYRQEEAKQAKHGYVMYSKLYSSEQAQIQYNMIKSELDDLVKHGKRSAIGNVYQYMTRSQVSELSYAQAKAYNKMANATGMNIKFNDIRHKTMDWIKSELDWDIIKNDRKLAKEYFNQHHCVSYDGFNFSSVEAYIAYKYFGSDPK